MMQYFIYFIHNKLKGLMCYIRPSHLTYRCVAGLFNYTYSRTVRMLVYYLKPVFFYIVAGVYQSC